MFQLIEADVGFDRNSRARVAEIWVIAGDDSESLAFRLPGEIRDGI